MRKAETLNRENVSVQMTWDLSGHMYGVQLVLKRKELTDDLAVEGPEHAREFNGEVDVSRHQTRACLLSRSDEGMQTAKTFLEYLEELDRQITARSDADVARGRPPIERPVCLAGDNHASRYGEEVLKAASGSCNRLGIRLWTEEPFTSGFLQSLDQYNSAFHRAYNKAKEVYKTAHKARYGSPLTSFGLPQFMSVLGGDEDLGLPGMWFTWADPFDIITAWRRVGSTGNVFAPELINRAEFIDQPLQLAAAAQEAAAAAVEAEAVSPGRGQRSAATVGSTPPGVDRHSAGAWKAKFEQMRKHAEELEKHAEELESKLAAQFNPLTTGLLEPDVVVKAPVRSKTRSKLSDMHGSFSMQDVSGEKQKRIAEDASATAEAAAKRQKAAEKKDESARARAEVVAGFEGCELACVCPSQPCVWSGWKRCPACGPKKGVCKVRVCVAARRPLALTYVPAEGPTEEVGDAAMVPA